VQSFSIASAQLKNCKNYVTIQKIIFTLKGINMYDLISRLTIKQLMTEQLPSFLVAFTLAELFYKFHSFILETGAFLITWYALGALQAKLKKAFIQKPAELDK
jgi:hypothetical protein